MVQTRRRALRFLGTGILGGVFLLSSLAIAWGNDISLSATVDKTELTLEDSLRLSLTIEGVQNAPRPELPPLPHFRTASVGTSASTRVLQGQMTVSVTYNYRLTPLKTGTFEIGPARLELGGQTYTSDPITVEVRKPAESAPASQLPAFVETTVSDKNPYVHQQVIYTFRLFRQVEAKNFNLDMPVDSSRFLKKEMGDAKRYSRVINGIRYEVHELSVALFPLRPGRVELAPAILELDLLKPPQRGRRGGPFSLFFDDPFFGPGRQAVHKILRTEPQPLTIRPLPKSGQPKDFANLVGQFEIDATLSKQEMEVGDSTTLTVTVSGTGSVKGVTIPLETLEERFKIYPDQPETRHSVKKGRMVEEKTFRFALVPLRQGRPTLPAVSISYFDPEKEDYLTQSTSPRELRVLPSSSEEPLNLVQSAPDSDPSKPTVQMLGKDILPLHTDLSEFENQRMTRGWTVFVAGQLLAPVLVFFGVAWTLHRRHRMQFDVARFRSRNAYKTARRKLDRLTRAPDPDPKDQARKLSKVLREYLGDKLNLEGRAITSAEVEAKMRTRQYTEEQVQSVRQMLEKYESLQFAPVSGGNGGDLLEESRALLDRLEKPA